MNAAGTSFGWVNFDLFDSEHPPFAEDDGRPLNCCFRTSNSMFWTPELREKAPRALSLTRARSLGEAKAKAKANANACVRAP